MEKSNKQTEQRGEEEKNVYRFDMESRKEQ